METFTRAVATKWGELKLRIFSSLCAALFALTFSGCAATYYSQTAHPEAPYNTYYGPYYYPYDPYYGYYGGAYYSQD